MNVDTANCNCLNSGAKWHRIPWSAFIKTVIPVISEFRCSALKIHYDVEIHDGNFRITKHAIILKSKIDIRQILSEVMHLDCFQEHDKYYAYFYTLSHTLGTWRLDSPCKDTLQDEPSYDLETVFLEHRFQNQTIPFISGPDSKKKID
jgi:hypothetical protein